jgi:hypothetical protein
MIKCISTILFLIASFHFSLQAQCLIAPAAPSCIGLNVPVMEGDRIDINQERFFNSSTNSTINSIRLNGGTLVICKGSLTIEKMEIDSGKIFINKGATLNILGSGIGSGTIQLKGNIEIYNRGVLSIKNILSLENTYASAAKPIIMINATNDAKMSVDNNWFIINTPHARFINNGYFNTHGIITDVLTAPKSICLSNSITEMTELHNKVGNAYTTPDGVSACIWVKNRSFPSDSLTNSPTLKLALNNGHLTYTTRLRPWGVAEVFNNTSACVSVFTTLPLQLKTFEVELKGLMNRLTWVADKTTANHYTFSIERSIDGRHFTTIKKIYGNALSDAYHYEDIALPNTTYYRIQVSDELSGERVYSKTQKIHVKLQDGFIAYPNPVSDKLIVTLPFIAKKEISSKLTDISGRTVPCTFNRLNEFTYQLHLPSTMAAGMYSLLVVADQKTFTKKFLKR